MQKEYGCMDNENEWLRIFGELGFFGKGKKIIFAQFDERFGQGNWAQRWYIDGKIEGYFIKTVSSAEHLAEEGMDEGVIKSLTARVDRCFPFVYTIITCVNPQMVAEEISCLEQMFQIEKISETA